jgi:hypothetical protein
MTTAYTIFTGCSYTEGIGLPNTINNKNLWVNMLYDSSENLSKTKLLNLGVGASSNLEIFQQSINALSSYNCRYLFVAWTALYRYKFSLGAELYDVGQHWNASTPLVDVNLNPDITYTKKYLTDIKNKFFSLHHDHYEIVKILAFTSAIIRLCKKLNVEVYFVNNILPWDPGYFNTVSNQNRVPSNTTLYTQKLLNAQTRDDEEFFKIYDVIHQEYRNTGGLLECQWLNLDRSFRNHFLLDLGDDDLHPGELSHQKFGEYLIEILQKKLI